MRYWTDINYFFYGHDSFSANIGKLIGCVGGQKDRAFFPGLAEGVMARAKDLDKLSQS